MKKQEKDKKAQAVAEETRQADETRKKTEEEARLKAQKEAEEKARAAAELKARQEAEWREKMRKTLAFFHRCKTDPTVIADEETFQLRHGLVINRSVMASTYQSQIYPVKREKPRLGGGGSPKPNNEVADQKMVVRVTVLEKCFTGYRKHMCEFSLKLIKFLGTPESPGQPALRHPSLVRVFDTFISDKKVYIFMEELPSATLSARIKTGPAMSFVEVQNTARQICDAILFLNRSGLAHLNVRADNFVWDDAKQVKLIGLSRIFQWWDPDLEQKIPHKAIPDKNYADHFPPEVSKDDFDSSLVDIFSFGALLYQMLVREKPFHGQYPFKGNEDLKAIWEGICAAKKDKMKMISAEVKTFLGQMVACKPEERLKLDQVLESAFFQAPAADANDASPAATPADTPADN